MNALEILVFLNKLIWDADAVGPDGARILAKGPGVGQGFRRGDPLAEFAPSTDSTETEDQSHCNRALGDDGADLENDLYYETLLTV